MASNLKYAVALKNAKLGAIGMAAFIGTSAKLRLYDGAQPASPDTAVSTQNMLCEMICNATQFGTSSGGVLTASTIAAGTGAAAAGSGTSATWYRIWKSDGTTPCVDGTVGISSADLNLNNPSIATGQGVSVTSLTYTEGN
jgi:hypothetical protein